MCRSTCIRYICIFAVILVVLLSATIQKTLAAQTTLTTTVPSSFFLEMEIEGGGSVAVNGVEYKNDAWFQIERLTAIPFFLMPESGYELDSVFYNGEDVTGEVQNGCFTLANIQGNSVLKVGFAPIMPTFLPQTGGEDTPYLWMGSLALALVITAIFFKKHTT